MAELLNQVFVFIDLETTGGSPPGDRIIEIGLKKVQDGNVIDEWQTLVNPQKTIPPFIEHYTGINNEMVQQAPLFSTVADTLKEKLHGAIFVAHNARFDYSFVKSEFRRINMAFSAKVLCTVKLSRRLYPQYIKHSMDALIERHGLSAGPRHRAMGDVDSMLAFFRHAVSEQGYEAVNTELKKILQRPSLPSYLPEDVLDELPQSHGVYRFYGENEVLLYVGKANNLYQRVMSHFSSDHTSAKEVRMSQRIRRLEWTETAGELGALLLESQQIKQLKPIHNQRLRAVNTLSTFTLDPNEQGYLTVKSVDTVNPERLDDYYGLFRTPNSAEKALQGISASNELCARMIGLDKGQGGCFQYQLGRCKGACVGEEDVTRYNLRAQIAFHTLRLKRWPYDGVIAVQERNDFTGKAEFHLIHNWVHLGTIHGKAQLQQAQEYLPGGQCSDSKAHFEMDNYKLMVKYLLSPKYRLKIIEVG